MAGRSVTLVEDDSSIAEMYRMGLEDHGFEVAVRGDAPALFEALETALPDVLVLDWNLPSMTGGQVLDRLRIDVRTRHLPVFILSAYPARHYAATVISRLGAMGWLEKTNTPPALLADKLDAVFGDGTHSR